MFYLNKETPLDEALLQKMFNRFHLEVAPKLRKYREYYEGIHPILKKAYKDPSKPCNKIIINYAKNICDSYCGYISTPGFISYSSDNDIEEIMDILRYNDYQAEDAEFLLDALVYGVAAELMYMDETSHTRFRTIDPSTCFGVCDDSLTGDLIYFVRFYKANEWDDSDIFNVDVYDDSTIKHYKMRGYNGACEYLSEEPHYFNQCPANIFTLPEEKSIFDCIISLQDAANTILSAEVDDIQAFVDAFLTITGADADDETIRSMKEDRVMLLPQGSQAQWLVKNANDTQVENILKRIQEAIYRIAACPDFSSESFVGGVSSGIAIRYRLTGMEQRAGKIEAAMKKALQRRIEIIAGIATLKLGEEVFRDIRIDFKRNIPEDMTSTIAIINSLKGTVSDATLLSQLPFVEDVNAEIEALNAQKQANMAVYGLGNFHTDDEDDLNE